ncbi:hypothetical protein DEO72_LG11g1797 [Vigna unguiculata]|uniref:Uncharacterized protein n=1 Tax=Vigna unguiculata TaxID=3917 RepID=A0A4D6NPC8_VIGUN|nr:hypothetical protein DEO72_LG11g1797 [Vigna unguiculata]
MLAAKLSTVTMTTPGGLSTSAPTLLATDHLYPCETLPHRLLYSRLLRATKTTAVTAIPSKRSPPTTNASYITIFPLYFSPTTNDIKQTVV